MKGKKIVCLVCMLAVILIPTAYEATENGLSQSVQRKQLAIIEEMESKTAVNLFSDMGVNRASEEWELYSIDGERDEYKDKSTGRKTYLFVKDKPILHGMIDYQNFDSSPSEESLKTEEELIEIAKSHLNAAFGEDFIKYRYSEITYDGFSNTYEVYFDIGLMIPCMRP